MKFVLAKVEDAKELSYLKKRIMEDTYRGIYNDEDKRNCQIYYVY